MARRSDPDTLTKPEAAEPESDAEATPEPAAPSLTLAGRPAAFRELLARDEWTVGAAAIRADRLLAERFPELVALQGEAREEHPDYPLYLEQRYSLVMLWPYLLGAWAGEGDPPTVTELEGARSAELRACLAEAARLNPDVPELRRFLPEEDGDPN